MKSILRKKFESFLESLKTEDNDNLLEIIEKGYNLCEALSTDDANLKQDGQAVGTHGVPANSVDTKQNLDAEWFDQTLADDVVVKVNKSQGGGHRIWKHAEPGRTPSLTDPLKTGHGTSSNTNYSE
jgi:hypothetical protein